MINCFKLKQNPDLSKCSKFIKKGNTEEKRHYITIYLHAIFNAHLVSKAGPVISGNFHHVRDFTWSSVYHTELLFTDKLRKTMFIINLDLQCKNL